MKKIKVTNRKSNENGITLIALVVTIIVMLILAGVTLSYGINGNKGLFVRAQNATTSYDKGSWQDKLDLYVQETILEHSGVITIDDYIEIVKAETGITDADINKTDSKNVYITVDKKFKFLATLVDESRINITYQGEVNN